MGTARFDTKKEATAWLVPDAIAHAVAPFLDLLAPAELDELRRFLDDAIALHPRLRTLATRAAASLVVVVVEPEDELAEAAKKVQRKVIAVPPKEPKPPELPYEGAPDLGNPKLHDTALKIIEALAKRYAAKWSYDLKDLTSSGWLVAVEIAPTWDRTKSSFESYLWRCAHSRMRDLCRAASHRKEKPFGCAYHDSISDDSKEPDQEKIFRSALDATATSHVLGTLVSGDPEDDAARAEQIGRLRAALAKLPDDHARLIEKIYFDGVPMEEAYAALEIPARTGQRAHLAALAALHEAMTGASNVRAFRPRPKRDD